MSVPEGVRALLWPPGKNKTVPPLPAVTATSTGPHLVSISRKSPMSLMIEAT
jgi:hypothetical protein